MEFKGKNAILIIVPAILLFIIFDCLISNAGSLEPNAPPQPTMVTLGQLSAQIQALSSPVKKVIRGVITFPTGQSVEQSQDFSPAVDPNFSVVLLSQAVASEHSTTTDDWISRTAVCVIELTEAQITLRVEPNPAEQKVSYQIIEYK